MKKTHIKWVIAHEPIDLFLKVAEMFETEVNEKTGDMFDIEVLSLSDYSNKYNGGKKITKHDLIDMVNTGKIEMSHIYTNWLGDFNADMYALDLPYLFTDHDHADAVLEGEIGAGLFAGIEANSNVKPLAFTYSGGFKIVPAKFAATDPRAWEGHEIRTSLSPVSQATFDVLGANTREDIDLEVMTDYADRGEIEGGESTWIRVLPLNQHKSFTHMNKTDHSLLMTSILVNQDFFGTFTDEVRKIMSNAAFRAAREERRQSVADVPGVMASLESIGVKIVELTDDEKAVMADATKSVYEKFEDTFTPGLVDAMRNAKK